MESNPQQPHNPDARSNAGVTVEPADRRFDAFIRGSLDGVFYLDVVRDANGVVGEFRVANLNERGASLLGRSIDTLRNRNLSDVLLPGHAQTLIERYGTVFEAGQTMEFEDTVSLAGTPRQILQQVIPLPDGVLVQAHDFTESRQAQQALRDNQEYLNSLIENAPIIIYELDHSGQFTLSTGHSLAQIGLTPGEAVGRSIFDFFASDSPEVEAFRRALTGETVSTETQLGDRWFASRYKPRLDDEGKIVGVLGVSYDITERRQAEEQLERAQRMEAVGQLTGGIAHDFNNLLAVILGNLDLLELRELDQGARDLVDNALAATNRGAVLTRQLLAFSRQQVLAPGITDLNVLIKGMLQLMQRTLPENIEIEFVPAVDLRPVHVDASQLEHAIVNLCVNARDAMPQGGKLGIQTRNARITAARAERLGIGAGDYVEAIVTDTGIGIAEHLQARVFEPFFTTKAAGKGSGLGLSMVYGFVNQSDGAIDLVSEEGKGTRIGLLFPEVTPTQRQHVREEEEATAVFHGHGERILVVEDDWDVRKFVKTALSSLNYEVGEAREGTAALGILSEAENVDVLLTDIVLPGAMNGIALARKAREMKPGLKVLLTTGYAKGANPIDLVTMSEFRTIAKPYRITELGRNLRSLIDE